MQELEIGLISVFLSFFSFFFFLPTFHLNTDYISLPVAKFNFVIAISV